jgi:hypothetical protein
VVVEVSSLILDGDVHVHVTMSGKEKMRKSMIDFEKLTRDFEPKVVDEHAFPPIVNAREFVAATLTRPSEIVKGLLHKGTKLVIGGGSKAFKTWTQLDLAISVAEGIPWIGFETIRSKVLYINFEIHAEFFQERIASVTEARGLPCAPENLDVWNLRGYANSYQIVVPKIIERTKAVGYSLIICDPIYKLYGTTDENSAGEVAQLLNSMETICVKTGSSVAFGAHYSKGNQANKESIDRISGSGVFARDPDSIISFTKHEEDGAFTIEPILRNLPPVAPFVVRWDFPLMHRDAQLDPARLKQIKGRPNSASPDEVFSLLPEGGFLLKDWQEKALENCGISRSTFFRLKNELLASGKVLLSKIDSKWKPVNQQKVK